MDEVLDCFLLDGPLAELPEAASLQPCIEQLFIPIYHTGDKTAVGETSLSFALMNVHARVEGPKKHVAALRQLMMEIVLRASVFQTWWVKASYSAPLSPLRIMPKKTQMKPWEVLLPWMLVILPVSGLQYLLYTQANFEVAQPFIIRDNIIVERGSLRARLNS
ncbi:hypothetical protein Tco_0924722 [Tanacetum coccineum]|uniref:Uncharacterized protein n=1 Tax=Tanacetum coccineum TaxID=301880 RepID=A0ABQ5D7P8_9ASTR